MIDVAVEGSFENISVVMQQIQHLGSRKHLTGVAREQGQNTKFGGV